MNTGVAPKAETASAVAKNVNDGTITSSSRPTPHAISARCSAAVPLVTPMQKRAPRYSAKAFSNAATSEPMMKAVLSMTRDIATSTFAFIVWYCALRSTKGMERFGISDSNCEFDLNLVRMVVT